MAKLTRGDIYGSIVKKGRMKEGYERASDFAKAVTEETGVVLTRDVLYKIEQGKKVPSVTQYAAINSMLFGERFPKWIDQIVFGDYEEAK